MDTLLLRKSFEIVGFTYAADNWCETDLIARLIAEGRVDRDFAESHGTETVLDSIARAEGIDRQDEASFDSDHFPKVIFLDSAVSEDGEDEDNNIYADRCGECGCVLADEWEVTK